MQSPVKRIVQVGVLAGAAVQTAGLAQAIHPVFDSIAHFRFHITILLMIGLLALLVMKCGRSAVVVVAVIAAGAIGLAPAYGSLGPEPDAPERPLVLVQYNTLFKNRTPEAIVPQIGAAGADAVTLQEVSRRTAVIMNELAADYPFQQFCPFSPGGVAVLSRWPAVAQGCAEGLGLAWMQVEIDGRKVTIASLHLHWPYPFGQADQITALDPVFAALPQPVIVAGDFNAAPWSHAVERVAEASSTHAANGLRFSLRMATFGLGPWPFMPIDHVLLPDGVKAIDMHLGSSAGSDHLPVIARIALAHD